jgi:EAL domain-containing protein (putative c-di-GMP-specific phosphodiesterase class I)
MVASRVHDLLSREFVLSGHEVYTSASIGIALACDTYRTPEEVLRDADLAMYKAKHSGSTSFEVFDGEMHASAVAQLRLETDLRRALERGEFVIHYQPIVSLDTGRIMSFEALLRWEHPQRGLLYPADFIQAAEETGLIVPLGWWVLTEACRQTRRWQTLFPTDPPVGISINISGKVFMKPDMAGRLLRLLAEEGLSPGSVRLEITESALMDHEEAALLELNRLREAEVELHLDDFGTGYSSLSYLQRFSYNTLKIDRSFVRHMTEPGETAAIVKAIVGLGKMLNMNVIAEGVETREQLYRLRELDCPEAQGFWFSEPLDGPAVQALLGTGRLKN